MMIIKHILNFLLCGFLVALATILAAILVKFEIGGLIEVGGVYFIAGCVYGYLEGEKG